MTAEATFMVVPLIYPRPIMTTVKNSTVPELPVTVMLTALSYRKGDSTPVHSHPPDQHDY